MDRAYHYRGVILALLLWPALAVGWELDVRAGYRQDRLSWSIGTERCDYLSELTWRRLQSAQVQVNVQTRIWDRFLFEALAGGGPIVSGQDQDSDYGCCNRACEYSRTYGQSYGHVLDGRLGCGIACRRPQWGCCVSFWNGLFVSSQTVHCRKGRYRLWPVYGDDGYPEGIMEGDRPFDDPGVNAHYWAVWWGTYGGLTVQPACVRRCSWIAKGRLLAGIFNGRGDWPWRSFDHFTHLAPMLGVNGELQLTWALTCKSSLCLVGEATLMRTFRGIDRSYWPANTRAEQPMVATCFLNPVRESALSLSLGYKRIF